MRVHSALIRTCTTWWSTLLLIRRGGPARIGCRSRCKRLVFSLEFQYLSLFSTRTPSHAARTAVIATGIGDRDTRPVDAARMQHAAPMYLANARLATLTQRGRRLPRGVHRF